MKRKLVSSIIVLSCALHSATVESWACSPVLTSITNLFSAAGDSFYVTALNADGQLTGYFYGSSPVHAFRYQGLVVTDLGTLGGSISEGFGINSTGQIVGASTVGDSQFHAFVYSGGSLLDLGTLGGNYSSASFINDAGLIAGDSLLPGANETTAFLYTNGTMVSLGTLGGSYSSAFALNQKGQVAGESRLANGDTHAYISGATGLVDLGTLGGKYSSAFAVNDAGMVVGESSVTNEDIHGFILSAGAMTEIGTFGGTYSSAYLINSTGQVVGTATTLGDLETHGFIYTGGSVMDLGTLGGTAVYPDSVNSRGQVVGTATMSDGTYHAFLWQAGKILDLNTLLPADSGWELSEAQFINDSGRIVGSGVFNGVSQSFIMDTTSTNNAPVAVAGKDQTVDCQAQVTLDGSGSTDPDNDSLTYEWSSAGAILGSTPILSVSLPLGTNIVLLKVSDPCGASAQANLTVIVADTTPPVGTCPGSATASADAKCQAQVPNFTSQVFATDNCASSQALIIAQNPAAGTLVGLGQHTVTITVTDPSGNGSACSVLFTVVDSTPPTIVTTPTVPTLSAGSDCQAQIPNILSGVVATDSCTPESQLVKTQDPAAGTFIGIGTHVINVTVTDAAGNSSFASVTIKVADTTPPLIQSSSSSTKVAVDSNCQGIVPNVLSGLLVTDNCTPANQIVLTQNPVAGTSLPRGSYSITITATDASGNYSTVNVPLEVADTTAPSILGSPAALTIAADAHCQGLVPDVLSKIVANDNCTLANQLILAQNPAAGTVLPCGQYTIAVTVADASGNTAAVSVPLSIVDKTPPVIASLVANPSVLGPPNHQLVPVTVSAVVTDSCDAAPMTKIVSITCNESTSPGEIQITGALTANLAATKPASGNSRTYTITVQSTDAAGNSSSSLVDVSVPKSKGTGNGH